MHQRFPLVSFFGHRIVSGNIGFTEAGDDFTAMIADAQMVQCSCGQLFFIQVMVCNFYSPIKVFSFSCEPVHAGKHLQQVSIHLYCCAAAIPVSMDVFCNPCKQRQVIQDLQHALAPGAFAQPLSEGNQPILHVFSCTENHLIGINGFIPESFF